MPTINSVTIAINISDGAYTWVMIHSYIFPYMAYAIALTLDVQIISFLIIENH